MTNRPTAWPTARIERHDQRDPMDAGPCFTCENLPVTTPP